MSPPRIVSCVGARSLERVIEDARAAPEGALVEIRLDRLDEPAGDLRALLRRIGRECIATLRSAGEGGEFSGSADEAARRLFDADAAGFDWLDLEKDVAARLPRGRARRIVSWHGPMPADPGAIEQVIRGLRSLDADVVKVASEAEDPAQALSFVRSAERAGRELAIPVVAIAMGAAGRWLRPLAGSTSGPLLYSAAHAARRTAGGQITAREAIDVFRAHRITKDTRVYAVVGADVSRSLSPAVHNRVFTRLGIDAVYVSMDAGLFSDALDAARAFPIRGLSVTSPHKRAAFEAAVEHDDDAALAGVANTLLLDEAGIARALNTDTAGFLAGLELAIADPEAARAVCVGHTLEPLLRLDGARALRSERMGIRTALVIGAGGVAHAVAAGLRARGVRTAVTARDPGAAAALAIRVGGVEAVSPGRAASSAFDLLVKTTPALDPAFLDATDFAASGFAADVVYAPLDTDFLLAARKLGRIPVPGLLMFAEQAVLQAALFTGRAATDLRPIVAAALAHALSLPL